ncbi:MAG: hypothetical protein N2Z21_09545 [Candidatus Sumerlaeaceae bacterium]|nr:hypothetical protein [Candidatus Sumerlaeaceae bacterium]
MSEKFIPSVEKGPFSHSPPVLVIIVVVPRFVGKEKGMNALFDRRRIKDVGWHAAPARWATKN